MRPSGGSVKVSEEYLAVGKIVKPHGIRGELKVVPYSGVAEDLRCYNEFYIGRGGRYEVYPVTRSHVHGAFLLLTLSVVGSRDAAEQLAGTELYVLKATLPALAVDEFYWHDVVGMAVMTEDGRELGRVEGLIATGANDVMVVTGLGREYLVPAIASVLVSLDHKAKQIVISPMPGLLEMNGPDAD